MNAAAKFTSAQAETVTRHVGNCQLCEGDFKLTDGKRMVHHGYKRPGHGSIEGDCPGVDCLPYETSCENIKHYVAGLRVQLADVREYLAKIATGTVVYFEETEINWRTRRLVHNHFSKYVSAHFDAALDRKERSLKYEASSLESDITRRDARIATWTLKPTRTVEEMAAKEQAEKDAARAVRAVAKTERDAKKAATKAKMDALEARRKAVRDSYLERLTALAAQAPSGARNVEADKLFAEMTSKKGMKASDLHYIGQLHVPHLFVALGLGTYRGDEKNINGWGDRMTDFHFTNGVGGHF